jgi:hypothetical protein
MLQCGLSVYINFKVFFNMNIKNLNGQKMQIFLSSLSFYVAYIRYRMFSLPLV